MLGNTSIPRAGAERSRDLTLCPSSEPLQLFWGAPPNQGCPKGSLELSLELPAWLCCLLLGLELLPRVISLSCQGSQHSTALSQLCPPRRKGKRQSGRLRDSTQAPDSHFLCLFPFPHPSHHLWLCLSGTSARSSIALLCQQSSLTNSQQ